MPQCLITSETSSPRQLSLQILATSATLLILRQRCVSPAPDGAFLASVLVPSTDDGYNRLWRGSWLKTSPTMSPYRARREKRPDVDIPALVPPLEASLEVADSYKLLWAQRWRYPSEHIGLKEASVALSSLKRSARVNSLCGKRKLTISDNLPVVVAFVKGR